MPTKKQLVVSTLRHLAKQCLREQMRLKVIKSAQRQLADEEDRTLSKIRSVKARIDRELATSRTILGLPKTDD